MRLPGTFNLANNALPNPQFLHDYAVFKKKQAKAYEEYRASEYAKKYAKKLQKKDPGGRYEVVRSKKESGDKQDGGNKKEGNQNSNGQNQSKGNNNSNNKNQNSNNDGNDDGEEWTPAQDKQLLEEKLAGGQWNIMAVNIGKQPEQLKKRWLEIKPADWVPNQQNGGGNNNNSNNNNQKNGNGGGNQNNNSNGGNGGGGGGQMTKAEKKAAKKEAKEADKQSAPAPNAISNSSSEEQVWTAPKTAMGLPGGWSPADWQALDGLAREEIRQMWGKMSKKILLEQNKQIHPDDLAALVSGYGLGQ